MVGGLNLCGLARLGKVLRRTVPRSRPGVLLRVSVPTGKIRVYRGAHFLPNG